MPLSAHKHSSLFQSQICVRPHFPQNVSQQTDAEASIRIQLFAIKPDIRDLKTCETMPKLELTFDLLKEKRRENLATALTLKQEVRYDVSVIN